jgi:hypothetical protein
MFRYNIWIISTSENEQIIGKYHSRVLEKIVSAAVVKSVANK